MMSKRLVHLTDGTNLIIGDGELLFCHLNPGL